MPPREIVEEIERKVDDGKMEKKLMEEGTAKFADPQKALLQLIREKRSSLASHPAAAGAR
jgi:transaldolase